MDLDGAERQPLLRKNDRKRLKALKILIAVLVVVLITSVSVLLFKFKNSGTQKSNNGSVF